MRTAWMLEIVACWLLGLAGCSGDYDNMSFPPEVESSPGPAAGSPELGSSPAVLGGEPGVEVGGPGSARPRGPGEREPAGGTGADAAVSGLGRGPRGGDRAASERPFAPPHPAGLPQPSPRDAPPRIELARGIALPQTGPEGIMMGFHLEYRWQTGQADPSRRYFLVIQRARGTAIRQAVQLASEGSWDGFALRWRPEEGPFQAHIEDDRGNRLSRSLPLD